MKTICTPTRVNRIKLFAKVWLLPFLLVVASEASATIRYVKAGASGTGTSWSSASSDLQAMINASSSGDEIWVAAGAYIPNRRADATGTITTGDRNNAFVMKSGVKIYGGFAGTETALSQRNLLLTANTSFLSGDLNSNDNGFLNNSENAYHVVVCTGDAGTAMLDGFTILSGNSDGGSSITVNGQYLGTNGGGGISINASSPTLSNLIIKQNAGRYGAGLCISSCSSAIINCSIYGNAGYYGGGAICSSSDAAFTNVLITGNTAVEQGGGMYNQFGSVAPLLTNVTIAGNSANNAGGAMYNNLAAALQLRNCIVYGNNTGIYNNSGNPALEYSLVQGETGTANGNISGAVDPLFVNGLSAGLNTGGDYRLQPCSQLVNKGLNDYYSMYLPGKPYNADGTKNMNDTPVLRLPALSGITTDLAGNARFYNSGTVDLGAYERQGTPSVIVSGAGIVYVKASGTGTGASWDCATSDLQAAINAAVSGNQVWVAGGGYTPASGVSFNMKEGVKIYGGFAGTETALSQRDLSVTANSSTLIGNSGAGISNNASSSVRLTTAALLDGFTISGSASCVRNTNYASPAFANCTFTGISADYGGGMYNSSYSSPVLTNCTFSNNQAVNGGGMYNANYSSPTLTNCIFSSNSTISGSGGAMYNSEYAYPMLTNCSFINNSAYLHGGGVFSNNSNSDATYSVARFTNCTFSGNSAVSGSGGGLCSYTNYGIVLSNCSVIGNKAILNGGGVYASSIVSLVNCLLSGNVANKRGGGIAAENGRSGFTNCTIAGNVASEYAGGAYINNNISQIQNTIIYNNNSGIYIAYGSGPIIRNSIIQGINATDPLFVNPVTPGLSTGGDYRLQPCSPAVDAGSNGYAISITTDLDGNSRIYNGAVVDIGAYEQQAVNLPTTVSATGIVYVKPGAHGSGQSWICATGDLQAAIDAAASGDQVWVATGTYKPVRRADATGAITAGDRNNAFVLKSGVKIYGGFAGGETLFSQRNSTNNKTILSGDLNGDDNGFTNNSDNAYHVVVSAGDVGAAVLDGFTIQGGNCDGGAGITVNGVGVGTNGGGGINCSNSSPTLSNLIIQMNAGRYGAGLCLGNSSAAISYCNIYSNAGFYGGGVLGSNCGASFTNVLISGNTAVEQGGGMYNEFSVAPTLTNVTIAGNTANNAGGAMYNNLGPGLQLRNSIVYGNNTGIFNNNGTPVIQYSIVQGETGNLNGNISSDVGPAFTNPASPGLNAGGDYSLQSCSQAINAGNSALYNGGQTPDLSAITSDLKGLQRVQGTAIDMGVYEYSGGNNSNPDGSILLPAAGDVATASISGRTKLFSSTSGCYQLMAILQPDAAATAISGTVNGKVWIDSGMITDYGWRHYQINPVANATTATGRISLYFTQAEFDIYNGFSFNTAKLPTGPSDAAGIANLVIEERTGASSDGSGDQQTFSGTPVIIDPVNADVVWNGSYWAVSFNVTGFGGFWVKAQASPLPLTLLSFNGSKQNGYNKLQWVTADEVNTKYFVLERSTDGSSFIQTGVVAANGRGGAYGYNDPVAFTGKIFYRLKMVDADGKYTYSPMVTLKSDGSSTVSIYPNPVSDVLTINTGAAFLHSQAGLYDANGRFIQNILITGNPQTINVQQLAGGLYFLKFSNGISEKFIKK